MNLFLFEDVVVSVELALIIVELGVLIVILTHMRKMREHSEVERQELREIKRLHGELDETVKLLKNDIMELNENQTEMHELIKVLAKK